MRKINIVSDSETFTSNVVVQLPNGDCGHDEVKLKVTYLLQEAKAEGHGVDAWPKANVKNVIWDEETLVLEDAPSKEAVLAWMFANKSFSTAMQAGYVAATQKKNQISFY